MRRLLPIVVILCTFPTPLEAQESGRLEAVREEVRSDKKETSPAKPAPTNATSSDKSSWSPEFQPDMDDEGKEALMELCLFGAIMPWLLPHAALNDDIHNDSYFRLYPYSRGGHGPMWIDHVDDKSHNEPATQLDAHRFKGWLATISVDECNDFRGLNRVNGQFLFDTWTRFGIQSDWSWLHEQYACGCTDDLLLGDINLVYRFAQCEWMQMRSGLGLRMLFDRNDAYFGFNFTYGADIFPVKPVVASFVFDGGTVGDAWLGHARATIGISYHRFEAFVGYDWLRIGDVDLSGPVAGMKFWF